MYIYMHSENILLLLLLLLLLLSILLGTVLFTSTFNYYIVNNNLGCVFRMNIGQSIIVT